jgi:hypothetical protein
LSAITTFGCQLNLWWYNSGKGIDMKTIMICQKKAGNRQQMFRDIKEFCGALAVCVMLVAILGVESWVEYLL